MLSTTNINPNFGSTRIMVKPEEMKQPLVKITDKYVSPLKQHFNVRAAMQDMEDNWISSQRVADDLRKGEAGVAISMDCDQIIAYGKDKESDSFIGKLLTKLFPENTTFTENII